MNEMAKRFDAAISEQKFSVFEILGFQKDHELSLKAGMAMGYQMAIEDIKQGATGAAPRD